MITSRPLGIRLQILTPRAHKGEGDCEIDKVELSQPQPGPNNDGQAWQARYCVPRYPAGQTVAWKLVR